MVLGGDNLVSPVEIGLADLENIWGAPVAPLAPQVPASLSSRLPPLDGVDASDTIDTGCHSQDFLIISVIL